MAFLSDGRARKSKLSRLLTAGNLASFDASLGGASPAPLQQIGV
jgi:hypothetical protein